MKISNCPANLPAACLVRKSNVEPRSEFPFDLAVLDTAREMYFLPHMDRLAGYLASQSSQPLQVRLEAQNQFIEYTLTKDPALPIEASLNGIPFVVTSRPAEDGSLELTGKSAAGDFDGNFYINAPDGTQVTGLAGPNRMPVNHSLWKVENPGSGDPVLEAMGNFACARMAQAYYPEGERLHLMGNMGVHDVDAMLSTTENGWLLEGEFGDMHFRQTFTPVANS